MKGFKLKFTNKDVLLFDLDGTLIDSVPDLALSVNQMLTSLGMNTYPINDIRSWVGNGAAVLTKRALSGSINIKADLNADFVEKALATFLDYYQQNVCVDTTVYPNVANTLAALHNSGYQMVIVTNKPEQFVRPILEKLGLNTYFSMIVGGDSLSKRKPDPMQLHYVCEQLKVSESQCIMIGDSKNDIHAAVAANMDSIALTYGYNHGEDIHSHGANVVLDDFAELLDVLDTIGEPVS